MRTESDLEKRICLSSRLAKKVMEHNGQVRVEDSHFPYRTGRTYILLLFTIFEQKNNAKKKSYSDAFQTNPEKFEPLLFLGMLIQLPKKQYQDSNLINGYQYLQPFSQQLPTAISFPNRWPGSQKAPLTQGLDEIPEICAIQSIHSMVFLGITKKNEIHNAITIPKLFYRNIMVVFKHATASEFCHPYLSKISELKPAPQAFRHRNPVLGCG